MNLNGFNSDYYSPMHSETKWYKGAVILFSGLLFACSTALYLPKENSQVSGSELEYLLKGRKAYIRKCGSCHTLVLPQKYSENEWKAIMVQMAERSHLTSDEYRSIQNYLTSPGKK